MTVNEIFRTYSNEYLAEYPFTSIFERKIINSISKCRTAKMGGRIEKCDHCGHKVLYYNSCRNRHCPSCQFIKKEQWIESRQNEVLPFQYFHVVFTIPDRLNPIVYRNKRIMYNLLFKAVKETLIDIALTEKYFGAKIGFFSILHTWGQKLNLHPHLHCVVPGGGYDEAAKIWKKTPKNYLLPIIVLRKRFRSLFLKNLKLLYNENELYLKGTKYQDPELFQNLIDNLFKTEWVLYLKESFNNSDSVIKYLAKYTHRIAISNYRIIKVEDRCVHFWYKDYKDNNKKKVMVVDVIKFIRLFLLHVVPKRYIRIRYYGLLSHRCKKSNIEACYRFFNIKQKYREEPKSLAELMLELTGTDIRKCPKCGKGFMVKTKELPAQRYRPPPEKIA